MQVNPRRTHFDESTEVTNEKQNQRQTNSPSVTAWSYDMETLADTVPRTIVSTCLRKAREHRSLRKRFAWALVCAQIVFKCLYSAESADVIYLGRSTCWQDRSQNGTMLVAAPQTHCAGRRQYFVSSYLHCRITRKWFSTSFSESHDREALENTPQMEPRPSVAAHAQHQKETNKRPAIQVHHCHSCHCHFVMLLVCPKEKMIHLVSGMARVTHAARVDVVCSFTRAGVTSEAVGPL